jgi:hypothetical protein
MSQAMVIGNGESRRSVDLNSLKSKYTLIGCNALHRDITVDHLVCCDRRMAEEAVTNPNTKETIIYVRDSWYRFFRKILKNKNIQTVPELPYVGEMKRDQPDHWGSGGYAVLLAATLGYDQIDILGFDLYPINEKVNNVYKGSVNYAKPDGQAVDYSYWVYQIGQIFLHYPNINFRIINHSKWEMPTSWNKPNVVFTNIDELIA